MNVEKNMIGAVLALFPLVFIAGCSNPADGVPAAAVSATTNAPAGAVAEANAKYYSFGPGMGTVDFVGSKVTGKHDGGFRNFVGELSVADGRLLGQGNKVVIDIDSLWSDNDRLSGHLKSPDFFDAARFPTATFVTTGIEQGGDATATVTGNLTMHGVTRQISFPANIDVKEDEVRIVAEFFINRFDFDMKYPGKADDLIRPEVVLKLNLAAKPGRADFSAIEKGTSS